MKILSPLKVLNRIMLIITLPVIPLILPHLCSLKEKKESDWPVEDNDLNIVSPEFVTTFPIYNIYNRCH